jgi:DUF4097 and DUF4098 domain-containing protein YvlB
MSVADDVDSRQTVRISSPHHRVEVVAEDRDDILVRGRADTRRLGSRLTVENVGGALRVSVPAGTDVQVGTESARVMVRGPVGATAISTSSGRVQIETAESVDVRTKNGRVEVGESSGDVRLRSSNGRITLGRCGDADLATESGRIQVRSASGKVTANCVSGRIEVGMATAADVTAETVSGRIAVSVPQGSHPFRPASDEDASDRPEDCDCTIVARSVSGRVDVSSP